MGSWLSKEKPPKPSPPLVKKYTEEWEQDTKWTNATQIFDEMNCIPSSGPRNLIREYFLWGTADDINEAFQARCGSPFRLTITSNPTVQPLLHIVHWDHKQSGGIKEGIITKHIGDALADVYKGESVYSYFSGFDSPSLVFCDRGLLWEGTQRIRCADGTNRFRRVTFPPPRCYLMRHGCLNGKINVCMEQRVTVYCIDE
jgi:hypothetical protein